LELRVLLFQLVVEGSDERAGFPQLLSDIGLVLGISAFYESCKAFGHEPNLMAESLDQYPGVSLDLLKPVIDALVDLLKPLIKRRKPLIHRVKPLIVRVEPSLNTIESLIERVKPTIKVLNEFVIHAASAAGEG
jgi:hypothetical protein